MRLFDKYDAYGEVPVPGTRTPHLPAGDVKVSFHTEIAGTMEGGGLPIPQNLHVAITPSGGGATDVHPKPRRHRRRQSGRACPSRDGTRPRNG